MSHLRQSWNVQNKLQATSRTRNDQKGKKRKNEEEDFQLEIVMQHSQFSPSEDMSTGVEKKFNKR